MYRRPILFAMLAAFLGLAVMTGGDSRSQPAATPVATPVADAYAAITSQVFVQGPPAPVENGELALAMITVPPGAVISPHVHPGSQFATITAGELTYTVETGEVLVKRAGTPSDAPWGSIMPGETVVLTAGDSIREAPNQIHHAVNNGDEAVVIWAATLFPANEPRAIPAPADPAATPEA
jgi:quercetin dioxygenase-like cupin family protein